MEYEERQYKEGTRLNPKHSPGDTYTVSICEKCLEAYEADYEHICKEKNSIPFNYIIPGDNGNVKDDR